MTGAILAGALIGWLSAEGSKSQAVRLLDVGVIGPIIIGAASRCPEQSALLRAALASIGAATITYNARNYLEP